jgi:hypothetical protein
MLQYITHTDQQQKFYLVVAVCQTTPITELVQKIRTRSRIPKEAVIADRTSRLRLIIGAG